MTIASELTTLSTTKQALKLALENVGEDMANTAFAGYPDLIDGLEQKEALEAWTRNRYWLDLPAVDPIEQKITILHRVGKDSNFCAFLLTGGYTVDWGDGTVEDFSGGATAYHEYSFSNALIENTGVPVTFSEIDNVFTSAGHQLVNGDVIRPYNKTGASVIENDRDYFVINATADTFQLSYTLGGAAIVVVAPGTFDLLPYRQAIITITPQAGQTIQYCNFNIKHNKAGLVGYSSGFLDMVLSLPDCTDFRLGSSSVGSWTVSIYHMRLEQVRILSLAETTFIAKFRQLVSLASIEINNSGIITSTVEMFRDCRALSIAPVFDTSAVTNATHMFSDCTRLQTIPVYDFGEALTVDSVFNNCFTLTEIPLLDFNKVTSAIGAFSYCYRLKSVKTLSFPALVTANNLFYSCRSLAEVGDLNFPSATTLSSAFYGCGALKKIGKITTSNALLDLSQAFMGCVALIAAPEITNVTYVTNASSMFRECSDLIYSPNYDFQRCTNFTQFMTTCTSLREAPKLNTVAATTTASMFNGCYSLARVPTLQMTNVTNANAMFTGCPSLEEVILNDLRVNAAVSNCKLSAAALDSFYTALGTVTAKSLTVTNNHGTNADNPSIATAKGWTVTG